MIYKYKGFINSCNGKVAIRASEVDGLKIKENKDKSTNHYRLIVKWHGGEDAICSYRNLDQALEGLNSVIDMIEDEAQTVM